MKPVSMLQQAQGPGVPELTAGIDRLESLYSKVLAGTDGGPTFDFIQPTLRLVKAFRDGSTRRETSRGPLPLLQSLMNWTKQLPRRKRSTLSSEDVLHQLLQPPAGSRVKVVARKKKEKDVKGESDSGSEEQVLLERKRKPRKRGKGGKTGGTAGTEVSDSGEGIDLLQPPVKETRG
ncbi:unnamed protein product, partial [Symbiodinium sp. KB8]